MISNEGMNNIINGLYWNHEFKDMNSYVYNDIEIDEHKEEDFKRLAKKLFKLNQFALFERYPQEKKKPTDYIKIPPFKWKDNTINEYQFLMSVSCLIYQCSEGKAINKKLYKLLKLLEHAILKHIVCRQEEYNKAKWG